MQLLTHKKAYTYLDSFKKQGFIINHFEQFFEVNQEKILILYN